MFGLRKKIYKLSSALVIVFVLSAISLSVFAQDDFGCDELSNRKAQKKFDKAMSLPKYQKKETYNLLLEVVKLEPEFAEAWYILADMNRAKAENSSNDISNSKQKFLKRAYNYYEKVTETCPAFDYYYSYFFLGKYHFQRKEYDKAQSYLNKFISNNSTSKKDIEEAKTMLDKMQAYLDLIHTPVPFNPMPLKGVSTKEDEYLPLVSPDGSLLFFVHRFHDYDKYTTIQKQHELFTISRKLDDEDGYLVYSKGQKMPEPFNQGQNQGAAAITIDNNHIYMTICTFTSANNSAYNNCDIYSSDYEDGYWTEFRNLGPNINRDNTWESQPTISADGNTLFFASIRKENIGFDYYNQSADIYMSQRDSEGNWQKAVNLGPVINSAGDDKSPFLHSDSKTLYFASNGHGGVGGYDIFYSKKLDSINWSEPKNIGYPINTEKDELGFIVSTDGKTAYFSSNNMKGVGGWDIYSFDLYKEARPEKVMFVKGQLNDDMGEAITNADVELRSANTGRSSSGLVDKITGHFAVAVSYEEDEEFIMIVKKSGYAFTSRYLKPEFEDEVELFDSLEIELDPVEVGVTVKLHNILFETNSAEFDDASRIVLDNFVDFLKDNPTIKIAIQGHTDDVGTAADNLSLSRRRADAVKDYLAKKGIAADRMTSKGFGESMPVANNETEEGRALNRRTEFVITSK